MARHDPVPERPLKFLAKELQAGRLVLFVGAGLSHLAPAKDGSRRRLPLWDGLLDHIAKEFGINRSEFSDDPLRVLDMAVTVRDRPALIAEVANCIDAENFDPSKAHKELKDLPWAYFVTTNYDDLLNKDNKFRSIITEDLYLWEGVHSVKKLIYAIHGNLDNPHTLTREDYRCWGERNPRASRRLEDTLFNRTVLFVGYSISDPNFGDILNRVKRIMGDKSLTQKGLAPGLGA